MTSVVELVRYALTSIPGVKFVLTEHLCQDPLEAFFGRQRMSCGRKCQDIPTEHRISACTGISSYATLPW